MPKHCVILTAREYERLPARIATILAAEFDKAWSSGEGPFVVASQDGEPYDRLKDWLCGVLAIRRDEMFQDAEGKK